ncbi:SsrA-binding protein SmpB [Candidatus Saganbacteria bacterium]|uniref:SsrA-binding protein n=1 Tax=Candidatus Saganbacteria bacterium TaxID=2575572 RepID=A0A9D6UM68_UNCSA|nr:SsrA-binding protein SmpB [Candidatus Saganbacteria bacterium]
MAKYYKVVAENRKARFDYTILEVYKAGLVLTGNEVKSLRLGRVNLQDSFGRIEQEEVWLYGMHISPYLPAGRHGTTADKRKLEPLRPRKALLNKRELLKLVGKVSEKGLTVIPLKVYFEGNWAKVDLALAKAKKKYEKREELKIRAVKKEIETAFKEEIYDRKNKE